MFEMILLAVGIVFAVFGLAEFLHGLSLYFISPKKRSVTYSLVFLSGESPEIQLETAVKQYAWLGKRYADYLLAVDTGLSEYNSEVCRVIAEDVGAIYCTAEALKNNTEEYLPL